MLRMLKLGNLLLDGTPRIAVPFRDGHDAAYIAAAADAGADLFELRVDQFSRHDPNHVLGEIRKFAARPVLVTIRSAAEGGSWTASDDERLALYEAVLPHVDAVDVELSSVAIRDAVVAAAHLHAKPVILSFHDFQGMPTRADLDAIERDARAAGADIVKVAVMCRDGYTDVLELAAFTRAHAHKGVVVIGMGPHGVVTRIYLPMIGSLFTFAAYGQGSAPGQLPLPVMREIFRHTA